MHTIHMSGLGPRLAGRGRWGSWTATAAGATGGAGLEVKGGGSSWRMLGKCWKMLVKWWMIWPMKHETYMRLQHELGLNMISPVKKMDVTIDHENWMKTPDVTGISASKRISRLSINEHDRYVDELPVRFWWDIWDWIIFTKYIEWRNLWHVFAGRNMIHQRSIYNWYRSPVAILGYFWWMKRDEKNDDLYWDVQPWGFSWIEEWGLNWWRTMAGV